MYVRRFVLSLTGKIDSDRSATTAEKLRGTKVWAPTPGRVLGAGRGHPLPLWGSGGITPGKFLKTRMLNLAILVTTCCKISCYLKTTANKLGDTLLVPNPEVWGPVYPGPYGCCAYGLGHFTGRLKTREWKTREHKNSGVEIAGEEIAAP